MAAIELDYGDKEAALTTLIKPSNSLKPFPIVKTKFIPLQSRQRDHFNEAVIGNSHSGQSCR